MEKTKKFVCAVRVQSIFKSKEGHDERVPCVVWQRKNMEIQLFGMSGQGGSQEIFRTRIERLSCVSTMLTHLLYGKLFDFIGCICIDLGLYHAYATCTVLATESPWPWRLLSIAFYVI